MKTIIFFLLCFSASLEARSYTENSYESPGSLGVFNHLLKKGMVRDEKTALTIAIAIASSIYGKDEIESEKPFNVTLAKGVWTVTGSLPERAVGGVFIVKISQKTACILLVSHGQ